MHDLLKRLPLPTKLMLIAAIPVIFIAFLTVRLYNEKSRNVVFIESYLTRIKQSAAVTRLIDEMQKERLYSFEFVLNGMNKDSMMSQRTLTDSALKEVELYKDMMLRSFASYTFVGKLDTVRNQIDSNRSSTGAVIHYFSGTIFRLNTLNRPPTIFYGPLQDVFTKVHFQRLLSELITYQGIINANIYTVLFTKKYPAETLMGTYGTYDVYKSYEKEIEVKASPELKHHFDSLKKYNSLKKVDDYLDKLFATFKFDSTYNYLQWKDLSTTSLNDLRYLQLNLLQEVENEINNYYNSEKRSKTRTLIYLVLVSSVLAFVVVYMLAIINQSLKRLKRAALRMANGETDIPLAPSSKDAIGSLANSIKKVDVKNKELAMAAQQIGQGNFKVDVQPRSDEDILGHAILKMKDNLLQSTRQIERSREEFRKLADFMPQIVWTARPDGFIDYNNKKWYEITGAKDGFGDQSWIAILHPEDVGRCLTSWYHSVETGETYEIEYRFRDLRFNSYRWFLGRALPIRDENESIIKWFGTGTDIHDQKMQNAHLEEVVAQRTLDLKRSNDDLQQFAHVASHDLKEPVRKIRTFSQRLAEEYGSMVPEKGRTYIDKITSSSERMAQMIDSILSYSVVNATELGEETIDLQLMMEGIVSDLELLIVQKEASVKFEKLPKLKGIPTLIYQLFYNLVNNALKFSKEGVRPEICLSSRELPSSEAADLELSRNKKFVEIKVQDNGIGFNQEYADKVFNVFTRLNTRDKFEGTGLGLALCRKIVHRHGGIIYVKSVEGEGSVFHIVLPWG